jgi:molybdate transport system substrate-binding protein
MRQLVTGAALLLLCTAFLGMSAGCKGPAKTEQLLIRGAPSVDGLMSQLVTEFGAENPGIRVTSNCTCPPCVVFREGVTDGSFDLWAAWGDWEIERLEANGKARFTEATPVGTTRLAIAATTVHQEDIRELADLHKPSVRAIGVGDPEFVSSGHYAEEALTRIGLWQELQGRTKLSRSGCELLKWLSLDQGVDVALVFEACVEAENATVGVLQPLPADIAPPVPFILAVAQDAANASAARRFVAFVQSPKGKGILARNRVIGMGKQ